MIPGDQAMLEVKNFIWRSKFFGYIRKVRLSLLNESDLVLRNGLIQSQALPYDWSAA